MYEVDYTSGVTGQEKFCVTNYSDQLFIKQYGINLIGEGSAWESLQTNPLSFFPLWTVRDANVVVDQQRGLVVRTT